MTTNNSSDDRLDTWLDAQYSAFVHDLTGTLDIETGLAEAIQPSRFTELVTDLDGLLNLDAGLTAILTTGDPSLLVAPNRVAIFGPRGGGVGVTEWPVSGYTRIRAEHDASGSLVVIRFLPAASLREPGYRARVRADAQRLAGLQHSGVARVLEYVETDQGVAVVREHVDGVTVRTLLGDEDALGPQASLTVLKGMLLVLAAAHSRGVPHRGCTPATVLISRTCGVVLAEFGITGPLAAQSLASGTCFYLAPEGWDAGEAPPSADLYAAAATCFECVAGAPPFFSDDLAVLRSRHESTPPPIEVVPEAMRDLLRRGLAKAPADRPAGAVEFLTELEEAAVCGYGADWEACGRTELAELAAGARPPLRLDPATLVGTPRRSAPEGSFMGGFQLGRSDRIAAAVTFTLVLGLALAMMVPQGDIVGAISVAFTAASICASICASVCALFTLISVPGDACGRSTAVPRYLDLPRAVATRLGVRCGRRPSEEHQRTSTLV